MSRWQESFENHNVHKTLKDALALLGTDKNDTDSEAETEKRYAIKLLSSLQEVLSQVDPEYVPHDILNNIDNSIRDDNIWMQLDNYNQNGVKQHLKHANDHLQQKLLSHLANLWAIAKQSKAQRPLTQLEQAYDDFAQKIEEKHNDLSSKIDKINETIEQQEKQLSQLSEAVDNKKSEVDSFVNSWQEQFSDAQQERQKEFTEWKNKIDAESRQKVEELISNTSSELKEKKESFDKEVDEHINDSRQKHQEILGLYQLVAGDSVSASYEENANNEKRQADIWRRVAIFFIFLAVGWIGSSFWLSNTLNDEGHILWGEMTKIFSLTGILIFGAGYSAKQSDVHRKNERKTRWFALETKAIDPFIYSLGEEDQKALKHKISERLFGQNHTDNESDSNTVDLRSFNTIIDSIKKIVSG